MSTDRFSKTINELFRECRWDQARALLEQERAKDPSNHWVLTQLGVTLYEQRQYKAALQILVESQELVEDCPLTIWNLAGALSALGDYPDAMRCYAWLLKSEKTPDDDPCWESQEWTDALKADSIFRLGECFQRQGETDKAVQCYRQYLGLLSTGIKGGYSIEDVVHRLRSLNGSGLLSKSKAELRKAITTTLHLTGRRAVRNGAPPKVNLSAIADGERRTRRRARTAPSK